MRAKKRTKQLIVAAIAVSALGGVAPASAGCQRVELTVSAAGQTEHQNVCVAPTQYSETERYSDSIGFSPWVGVNVRVSTALP